MARFGQTALLYHCWYSVSLHLIMLPVLIGFNISWRSALSLSKSHLLCNYLYQLYRDVFDCPPRWSKHVADIPHTSINYELDNWCCRLLRRILFWKRSRCTEERYNVFILSSMVYTGMIRFHSPLRSYSIERRRMSVSDNGRAIYQDNGAIQVVFYLECL